MSDFSSLIFYLTSFSITGLLIKNTKYKKPNMLLVIIALSIPLLLATFREGVGTDYYNYLRSYNSVASISFKEYISSNFILELGHFIIRKGANLVNSYGLMLGIYASITVLFTYFTLKNHQEKISVALGLFLFLNIYFPMALNIMPQFAAISITMYALKYVFEKNIYRFIFFVFIASMFHTTALITIPIYFLWDKKEKKIVGKWKTISAILICTIVAFNYQLVIEHFTTIEFFGRYEIYSFENLRGQNRDLFLKIFLFIGILIFRKRLIKYDKRNELYILLLLFSVIIGFTGFTSPFVKRIGLYFEVTQIIMLPCIVRLFKTKDRLFINSLLFLYAVAYFTLVYYVWGHAHIVPYETYLFK